MMEQRRMGDSDLVCSALGFGTWEMSTTMYGHIDVQEATRAVQGAIDACITLFDTAENYGPYHSEEILGKALGARRKEILIQFLIESAVLCAIGGVLGLLLAAAVSGAISAATPIPMTITTGYILLSLFVSRVVGVIAGIYPAWRASRLDPVVALTRTA